MAVTVQDAVATFKARAAAEAEERASLAASVRQQLPAVATTLRERGAIEVWLFGSMATGRVHESSDVDIAVWGVPDDEVATLSYELTLRLGRHVDVVPLEGAPRLLVTRVREEGVRL